MFGSGSSHPKLLGLRLHSPALITTVPAPKQMYSITKTHCTWQWLAFPTIAYVKVAMPLF